MRSNRNLVGVVLLSTLVLFALSTLVPFGHDHEGRSDDCVVCKARSLSVADWLPCWSADAPADTSVAVGLEADPPLLALRAGPAAPRAPPSLKHS